MTRCVFRGQFPTVQSSRFIHRSCGFDLSARGNADRSGDSDGRLGLVAGGSRSTGGTWVNGNGDGGGATVVGDSRDRDARFEGLGIARSALRARNDWDAGARGGRGRWDRLGTRRAAGAAGAHSRDWDSRLEGLGVARSALSRGRAAWSRDDRDAGARGGGG
ncbi:hypothetical protein PHISCL_00815 [Aspergillus sclerotialis]|uniref:Uncharacterized protein n=1 Tax=Aspergillus sclerotialis TaxID=2070753 RepID=A0A3A2ZVN3_9EURO|nr:hypothetical protein PHISCL_00815 [Aspergillus sclerotialis]